MSNKRIKTDFIVVHSSQTTPEQDITQDIEEMHRKDGLLTIGYHKVIRRDGTIEDGRDIDLAGIHVEAKGDVSNANSISICLIGGLSITGEPDCNFTLAQFRALNELQVELQAYYVMSSLSVTEMCLILLVLILRYQNWASLFD